MNSNEGTHLCQIYAHIYCFLVIMHICEIYFIVYIFLRALISIEILHDSLDIRMVCMFILAFISSLCGLRKKIIFCRLDSIHTISEKDVFVLYSELNNSSLYFIVLKN